MVQALVKSRKAPTKPASSAGKTKTSEKNKPFPQASLTVNSWEDDPESGVPLTAPVPDLARTPLAFTFPGPAPKPNAYPPGTSQFRYWAAAVALRRGADYWATRVPLKKWQAGSSLKVILDLGEDLNAYYNRTALVFFHGPSPTGTVYSGESPDVLCHEMGHAVLDALKPELWGAASQEVAAFHESFGDISAIMSAIQLPSLRSAILAATGARFYQNSRLSRLAEQLGSAIRASEPTSVDKDCLRNAVNSFTYQDPATLPSRAPAVQLSSEPHSFSRLFTGAFFEILGACLAAKAANPKQPTEQELLSVANDLAGFLVGAVRNSSVVANWYAQVAAAMVVAAGSDAIYTSCVKGVFVRRGILSLHSAAFLPDVAQVAALAAVQKAAPALESLPTIGLSAPHYGVDGMLFVEAAVQPRQYLVTSAATDATPATPPSGSAAAMTFVDDLFTRGRIDYGNAVPEKYRLSDGGRLKTHALIKVDGGARLQRRLFDCGLCAYGLGH